MEMSEFTDWFSEYLDDLDPEDRADAIANAEEIDMDVDERD
jgi:hypothetical protein